MKYALAPCATNAHLFANPAEISKRTTANTVDPFFALYDLNKDEKIRYNEYQLVNRFHGRSIKGATETFVFLDANNDWELTRDQVTKAKIANLDPKLPASVRRKPPPPRHGHHAPAAATTTAATATAATAGSATATRQRVPVDVYDAPLPSRQRLDPGYQDYYNEPTNAYADPFDAAPG